ncbi:hypothetical protein EG334_18930 [Pectobacterium versatile]|nr:hypothetical protein EG334_18930 [Pectobacterium versatile]
MAENAGTIDSLLVSLGLETDAKSFQKGADAIIRLTSVHRVRLISLRLHSRKRRGQQTLRS